jgi:bifunctional NMN adenylyltransferase/nudix hydrolase
VAVDPVDAVRGLDIRNHLLGGKAVFDLGRFFAPAVIALLEKFMASPQGVYLRNEYAFIEDYKKGWDSAPFKPTHLTVDSVVVQSGHVLLVQRDARPGEGLWALPGGFVGQEEKLLDGAIRSLKDKTKIKVPTPVLYGSVKAQAEIDAPVRSDRGRTVTHAFYIELRGENELPKVKEGMNTRQCYWCPLAKLNPEVMFDDHYFIIQKMIGVL